MTDPRTDRRTEWWTDRLIHQYFEWQIDNSLIYRLIDWINDWLNEWLIEESSIDCSQRILKHSCLHVNYCIELLNRITANIVHWSQWNWRLSCIISYLFVRYTCRGLFERHKLLFSFQMCSKILEAAGKLNMDEYNFFLRGGVVSSIDSPFPLCFAFHFNRAIRTVVLHSESLRHIQRQKIFSRLSTSRYFTCLFSTMVY